MLFFVICFSCLISYLTIYCSGQATTSCKNVKKLQAIQKLAFSLNIAACHASACEHYNPPPSDPSVQGKREEY